MKNSKKLFLIVLSVLMVAFISCKDKATEPTTFKVSDIAGTWSGDGGLTIIIESNRSVTVNTSELQGLSFQIPEADWNSEKTEYTLNGDDLENPIPGLSITFKSASNGTLTTTSETFDIRKQ